MKSAQEIEAEVDALLGDELAKRKQVLREEIAARERHRVTMAHYDRINAHHVIEDPPSPEEMAQRRKWAAEALARDAAKIEANEERWREDETRREATLKQRLPRMRVGGSEGFARKKVL
jgi:hypothetical protein